MTSTDNLATEIAVLKNQQIHIAARADTDRSDMTQKIDKISDKIDRQDAKFDAILSRLDKMDGGIGFAK